MNSYYNENIPPTSFHTEQGWFSVGASAPNESTILPDSPMGPYGRVPAADGYGSAVPVILGMSGPTMGSATPPILGMSGVQANPFTRGAAGAGYPWSRSSYYPAAYRGMGVSIGAGFGVAPALAAVALLFGFGLLLDKKAKGS